MGSGDAKVDSSAKPAAAVQSGYSYPATAPLAKPMKQEEYMQYIECALFGAQQELVYLRQKIDRLLAYIRTMQKTQGLEPDEAALIAVHQFLRWRNDMDIYNEIMYQIIAIKQHIVSAEAFEHIGYNEDFLTRLSNLLYAKPFIKECIMERICDQSVLLFGIKVNKMNAYKAMIDLCGAKFSLAFVYRKYQEIY